jgi:phosphonate transport system substrate-binding protein
MTAQYPAVAPLRRRIVLAALGAAGGALARKLHAADTSGQGRALEFGVVPYLPTARLLTVFEPLRVHFVTAFQRPVVMSTAPDFKSFQRRALDGAYDLYFIGPGPGWQIHRDRQHLVAAVAKATLRILLLVAQAGPVQALADLRGKTLATIDPLTVTAQVAMAALREQGLMPGKDVSMRIEKTPFNAAQAVALGEAAAAACPDVAWPSLPAELREKLRILYRSEELPSGLLMARPARDAPSLEAIRRAVFEFSASPAGEIFGKESALAGFMPPDMAALTRLDRFLPEVRRVMGRSA